MGCCASKTALNVDDPQARLQAGASKAASKDVIAGKVAQAKNTKVLALRECGLKQLPPDATAPDQAQLKTIDVASNALKTLPDGISVWVNLKNLQCAQNSLTSLPDSVGQLASLITLNLTNNQLKTLPAVLAQCSSLQTLLLEGNKLGPRLPEEVFRGDLPALKEIVLSKNELEALPLSLGGLPGLERLLVSQNRLVALPIEIGGLKKLQHLDAGENSITALPDTFLTGLSSLSELWLKGNPMDRLKLQQAAGFDAFLARRKARLDEKIQANVVGRVDLTVCGLE